MGAIYRNTNQHVEFGNGFVGFYISGRLKGDGGLSKQTVLHFHRVLKEALQILAMQLSRQGQIGLRLPRSIAMLALSCWMRSRNHVFTYQLTLR